MNLRYLRRDFNPFAPPSAPKTAGDYQVCADLANFVLTLELAAKHGLIDTNGKPNVERCAKILEEARTKFAIVPRNLGPGRTTP